MRFTLWILAAMVLAGCGQVMSPLGAPGPAVPSGAQDGTLLTNFEGGGMFAGLGVVHQTGANPANSIIEAGLVYTSAPTQFYWDLSGTSASDVPGGSTLPAGTSAIGMRMWGTVGKNVGPDWPYAELGFPLSAVGVDLGALAPSGKMSFSYKGVTGSTYVSQYRLFFTDLTVLDYGWYGIIFPGAPIPALNGKWQSATINFPVTPTSPTPKFKQESWPLQILWAKVVTNITKIVFSPWPDNAAAKKFDLTIDDIWLR